MDEKRNEVLDIARAHKTREESAAPAKGTIHWQAEEFTYHEKDPQWFIVAGIVALGIFGSLLILKNVFGAATVLLFSVIIYMYATKKPTMLDVAADARSITVNGKLTPYSAVVSFWILYEPPVKDLILIHKARFAPKVIIPLGNTNPVELRELLLSNALIEKEEEESLVDILARRVGF